MNYTRSLFGIEPLSKKMVRAQMLLGGIKSKLDHVAMAS